MIPSLAAHLTLALSQGEREILAPGSDTIMDVHSIAKITLRSSDFARTERFYNQLFDWKFQQYSATYLGFEPPSGIGGGFQHRDSFIQGDSYLIYIQVDEFESYLRRIPELGGHTTGEVEVVSESVSYVRIYDPDGNRLALLKELLPAIDRANKSEITMRVTRIDPDFP